jgi:hypothetical protein
LVSGLIIRKFSILAQKIEPITQQRALCLISSFSSSCSASRQLKSPTLPSYLVNLFNSSISFGIIQLKVKILTRVCTFFRIILYYLFCLVSRLCTSSLWRCWWKKARKIEGCTRWKRNVTKRVKKFAGVLTRGRTTFSHYPGVGLANCWR